MLKTSTTLILLGTDGDGNRSSNVLPQVPLQHHKYCAAILHYRAANRNYMCVSEPPIGSTGADGRKVQGGSGPNQGVVQGQERWVPVTIAHMGSHTLFLAWNPPSCPQYK